GQLVQRLVVPVPPRLILAGLDLLDRQVAQLAFLGERRWRALTAPAEQGVQPASQSTFFRSSHALFLMMGGRRLEQRGSFAMRRWFDVVIRRRRGQPALAPDDFAGQSDVGDRA